jgi:hypothetical protein
MAKTYKDIYKKEYAQAPCFYIAKDDGAEFLCSSCKQLFNAKNTNLYLTFTPDLTPPEVLCDDCVDETWLMKAKNLGFQ